MATYYQGLSSQRENVQSLYPGDQKQLISYPEPASSAALNDMAIYMNQPSSSTSSFSEMLFIPPASDSMNLQSNDGQFNTAECKQNFQSQGLSLSLGAQVQSANSVPLVVQYQFPNVSYPPSLSTDLPLQGKWTLSSEDDENNHSKALGVSDSVSVFTESNRNVIRTEDSCNSHHWLGSQKNMHAEVHMYGPTEHANFTVLNCKFLKAAQQLLDEVVEVRHALKKPDQSKKALDDSPDEGPSGQSAISTSNGILSTDGRESTDNSSSDPSPTERQELQNKKTKLLSMLDEVDGRYRQYYHQMKTLVSSFDDVAGHGAAKTYTALALQTISRHFRCLRDAITDQLEVTRKRLGEQDNVLARIPRLRYVDHQVRQQRALQQLGVIRHSWRPQRGLPENSVSVLRAWLFEHFLHPYPNDSEKILLARQTGLTRNQVANWFINARVRLWKPMVEEMYKEEFCDSEANSKSSLDDAIKACADNHLALENRLDELAGCVTSSTTADGSQLRQDHDFKSSQNPSLDMKKPRAETMLYDGFQFHEDNVRDPEIRKFQCEQMSKMNNNHTLSEHQNVQYDQNGINGRHISASLAYGATELNEFAIGSRQVSLALGLQRQPIDAFSMSNGTQITDNDNLVAAPLGSEDLEYHCIESGKQHGRFGNSHLLHDFVV